MLCTASCCVFCFSAWYTVKIHKCSSFPLPLVRGSALCTPSFGLRVLCVQHAQYLQKVQWCSCCCNLSVSLTYTARHGVRCVLHDCPPPSRPPRPPPPPPHRVPWHPGRDTLDEQNLNGTIFCCCDCRDSLVIKGKKKSGKGRNNASVLLGLYVAGSRSVPVPTDLSCCLGRPNTAEAFLIVL